MKLDVKGQGSLKRAPIRLGFQNFRKWVPAIILILFSSLSQAQLITGFVYQSAEEGREKLPLAGVNVVWKGEAKGTSTDAKGSFSLPISPGNDTLCFSLVGYEIQCVYANPNVTISVVMRNRTLDAVVVTESKGSTWIQGDQTILSRNMAEKEFTKAACCNLSESFETTPSVDVTYSDALTGVKQIQLLGLAGSNAAVLREGIPMIRGLSAYLGWSLVPGPWLESVQLSKGTGSVQNGFESISGQMNVQLRKPHTGTDIFVNAYLNTMGRTEVNLHKATVLNEKWSTSIMAHGSVNPIAMDPDGDGFANNPVGGQVNLMNRWKYDNRKGWEGEGGLWFVSDRRQGGQMDFLHKESGHAPHAYGTQINQDRAELWAKAGHVFKSERRRSIGFMASALYHGTDAFFGYRNYDARQVSFYGNALYDHQINDDNAVKLVASIQADDMLEDFLAQRFYRREIISGGGAEYTYNNCHGWSVLLGLRADYNNLFGWFVTPRAHVKYNFNEHLSVRASTGRGQRTHNLIAETPHLWASSRRMYMQTVTAQAYGFRPDVAWSHGLGVTYDFKIAGRKASLAVEGYRIDFTRQVVTDLDHDPQAVHFYQLEGSSFSTSAMAELNLSPMKRMQVRMAYRYNDVQTNYMGTMRQVPFNAQHRGFLNVEYSTPKRITFDATLNAVGKKRIPFTREYAESVGFINEGPAYFVLHAQVSKKLKKGTELYLGMENITNFISNPIIVNPNNPFAPDFDATMAWGPLMQRLAYIGVRYPVK